MVPLSLFFVNSVKAPPISGTLHVGWVALWVWLPLSSVKCTGSACLGKPTLQHHSSEGQASKQYRVNGSLIARRGESLTGTLRDELVAVILKLQGLGESQDHHINYLREVLAICWRSTGTKFVHSFITHSFILPCKQAISCSSLFICCA